jgi:hypothetical protein
VPGFPREGVVKYLITCLLLGHASTALAADVRDIELRRLFEPTKSELEEEAEGRVYIYDGLHDKDVERAMEEEFDRIDGMMFIREKKTDDKGEVLKDPETGEDLVEDDGC